MKLIIGLGNPGGKYECTRHNVGFMLLNAFAQEKLTEGVVWLEETKFNAHVLKIGNCVLAKPQTYMNRSGESVSKLRSYYNVELIDVLIIHDDVDLNFGDFKYKKESGSAGHHGVEDIISKLGSKGFWRLRVGVGRPEEQKFKVDDFVLQRLSEEELKNLSDLCKNKLFGLIDGFIAN